MNLPPLASRLLSGFMRVCDYNPHYLITGDYDSAKNIVKVQLRQLAELKDIHMNFLLDMNEDFDDDLLMDAIELIHPEFDCWSK